MARRSGKSSEGHDEHAGAHGCLQLVAQNAGQDQQHHHPTACTDEAADRSDHGPADDRLYDAFSAADSIHGAFGGHDRLHDEPDPQQKCHKYGKTAHCGVGEKACDETSNGSEEQDGDHHDRSIADIEVFVLAIGVCTYGTGQDITGQCDPNGSIGWDP